MIRQRALQIVLISRHGPKGLQKSPAVKADPALNSFAASIPSRLSLAVGDY